MYEQHWHLQTGPFQNDGDPRFFFRSETHEAALLKLRYLVENNKGAGMLVGGSGMGKTYLVNVLAAELPDKYTPLVHLVFPQMSAPELLAYLAVELGAAEEEVSDVGLDRIVRRIHRLLVEFHEHGRQPVIVIDEAHLIEDRQVFEAFRLLLNFQQQGDADFTMLFVGQPSLLNRIGRMGELDDRLTVNCLLQPLTYDETIGYIAHRLETAGATQPIFATDSLETLFEESGGVPRKLNRLSDLSLLVGYADDSQQISKPQTEAVAEEVAGMVSY